MKNTFKKESKIQNLSFMLESPVPKVVLKMAVPTILSMLVMSVYGLSDMFFVSRLGTSASAAVGIVCLSCCSGDCWYHRLSLHFAVFSYASIKLEGKRYAVHVGFD